MKLSWQVGRIIVPEKNVIWRRIFSHQVVVDDIVPDEIVGPHPGEHARQVVALENALAPRILAGDLEAAIRNNLSEIAVVTLRVEHADHEGKRVDPLIVSGGQKARKRCGRDSA